MDLWQYVLLFLSVLLGGALAYSFKSKQVDRLKLVLSFSGAYLLGITVLHLIPAAFTVNPTTAGFWVLGGFFLQLALDFLSKGVEHGHLHKHEGIQKTSVISIMIGLCLHAFMEGLPLSTYQELGHLSHAGHDHNHLLYGIILHKAPAAFTLGVLLLTSNCSKFYTAICLSIFAAMSPLGAYLASFFGNINMVGYFTALVIGSFLHISTTILFEANEKSGHHLSWKKLVVIVIGVGLALLTM